MPGIFIKREGSGNRGMQREGPEMTAETGVMQLQPRDAKDHWQPPGARRAAWTGLRRGRRPADTLISDFYPPEL